MCSTVKFYHCLPSGEFACDEEPGYQPQHDGEAAKLLYQIESIPDDDSLFKDEGNNHFNTAVAIEKINLEATHLPDMIWTPTKYKQNKIFKFI